MAPLPSSSCMPAAGVCVRTSPGTESSDLVVVNSTDQPLRSISAVQAAPMGYLCWGGVVAVLTLVALVPLFLGLFVAMPILGHATWHLYCAVRVPD